MNTNEPSAIKDITSGILWTLGGVLLTLSPLGFIFWGAIVYGIYLFFRGLKNF